MPSKRERRKPAGVGAVLTLRYPAAEVPALDAAATDAGLTRGSFMYIAVSKEVERVQRRMQRTERREGERRAS